MVDAEFGHPRLAAIHDALDPDRSDLDAYVDLITEFGGRRVLDVGCGTGTLALLLAARGDDVIGVDPAAASLDVARAKPGARKVRWIHGYATAVTACDRDVAVMTANVAQAIVDPNAWTGTLRAIHGALRPGGRLMFETRDPAARAWLQWTKEATYAVTTTAEVGDVANWVEVVGVDGPLVTFRGTWEFFSDGASITSDSTLRFRERAEVHADLGDCGFDLIEVRDAPDRPGREMVFLAESRPARDSTAVRSSRAAGFLRSEPAQAVRSDDAAAPCLRD